MEFVIKWILTILSFTLLPSGFLLFKDFCMNEIDEAVPQLKFYEEVSLKCPVCVSCGVRRYHQEDERLGT